MNPDQQRAENIHFRHDQVWLALSAIPPRFFKMARNQRLWDIDQVMTMMSIAPLDNQRELLLYDLRQIS
jgi:hypothetical protein